MNETTTCLFMNNPAASSGVSTPKIAAKVFVPRGGELDPEKLNSPQRRIVLALALGMLVIGGCSRVEQGSAGATSPRARADLRALYDRIAVGDRVEFAEAVFGLPDRVSASTILGLDCTTYVYVDLLSGKSVALRFSLGGRLVSKSFEQKPPFLIN